MEILVALFLELGDTFMEGAVNRQVNQRVYCSLWVRVRDGGRNRGRGMAGFGVEGYS